MKYRELIGEKEVEHFWWDFMKEYFPNCEVHARETGKKTDGLLTDKENKIRTLIEVKEDLELKKSSEQAKVLIQSIFYIKKYEIAGEKLPKTVFVADKNEVFIVHTNALLKYLDYDIDWKKAPSQAYKNFPEMMIDIAEDEKINPFVFTIKEGFNFNAIKNKIVDLNQNVKRLIKVTDENLQQVFEYFVENVLGKNKLGVNEQVNLFIDLLINPDDNYLHPKKKNTIHSKSLGFVKVNEKNFLSFFEHFDGEQYTVREKERMVSIIDRLIEDETRKRQGEFFTPTIWVNEAHKMISEQFGEDWKEKYVVWDCAWGTGNLTRDYKFKELYCSTLHDSDIQTANQMKINPEAVKFQFDFLNDDLELLNDVDKAPGLYKAIKEGKEIIFLINPPYGRSNQSDDNTSKFGTIKKGGGDNKTSSLMKKNKIGGASSQLYTQFLYKIMSLKKYNKNINISVFAKSLYLSGTSFKGFRNVFLEEFNYIDGMLFQASHFDDVSSQWGIDFAIWKNGETQDKINFYHKIKDIDDFNIITIENKNIYNLDNEKSLSKYITYKPSLIEYPKLSSSLVIKDTNYGCGLDKNSFATLISNANNVAKNSQSVYIVNGGVSENVGKYAVNNTTFLDCVSIFMSRKLISGKYANWINDKDEYIAPTEEVLNSPEYKQWNNDAIIYSLFNTSSNQSSMRQVEYKDKLWDIKNEFFWMSKEEMMDLADEHFFDDLYQDARNSEERYVYKLLQETNLSPDAQELLDLSKELIKKSFKMRKFMNDEHPEYHLNTWDAGWYQMKKVLNEYYKEDYKEFVEKYKKLEDRMRPYVYKFGFLK